MLRPLPAAAFALSLLLGPGSARAGDPDQPGEEPADDAADDVIVVEAPRAEVRVLPGATMTSLDVSGEAARALDLGDLLAAVPGVTVRSTGGAGAPQLVQLRGAGGGEVRVLVDGMPLPQDASGAVDLSTLPLDAVERIEVTRGSLPLGLGGEGVAGAINLVTRRPRGLGELRYAGSAGSFGTFEGSAGLDLGRGAWRGGLTAAGARAQNDFPYLDDNGTPYVGSDDVDGVRRENADSRRGEVAARIEREGASSRLALTAGGVAQEAGVPGPGALQVGAARLSHRRADLGLRWERPGDISLCAGLEGHGDRQRYLDLGGEVGLGQQDETSNAGSAAVDGLLDWEFSAGHHAALALRAEHQALAADNALDSLGSALRRRERLSGTLEGRGERGAWGGGARLALDGAASHAAGALPMSWGAEATGLDGWLLSPSASLSWQASDVAGLRASGGRSHRLPTFPELFGSGGTVVGNEALRPERAWSADLGADLAWQPERGAVLLSLTGYGRHVQDLIAYLQNSQYTLRAENIAEVWVAGMEAEGSLDLEAGALGRAKLGLAWSLTRSLALAEGGSSRGAEVPGVPRQTLFADLTLGGPRLSGGLGVEARDRAFRDSANLQVMPARVLLHPRLAARPLRRGPRLVLEVRNALDHRTERSGLTDLSTGAPALQPVSDFLGYPLPGCAVYLSVEGSLPP
ncbi:MAG: TonB-dependent receptor [Pseudomonadota bacterium]